MSGKNKRRQAYPDSGLWEFSVCDGLVLSLLDLWWRQNTMVQRAWYWGRDAHLMEAGSRAGSRGRAQETGYTLQRHALVTYVLQLHPSF